MNTANLQLEGMVMAVASLCEALVDKGLLNHKEVGAAFERAMQAVEQDDAHKLSEANLAAAAFPIRLLSLANQAHERGKNFTFSDYAAIVGKLT
ncbi:hypothetical protein [Rhizobium mesosinicum]|uniref:Uncharacterized protein n=1 Tax=Rhizobium mesosinicum TaxID=335017 RepID=A0ABS7GNZ2_9HYPH|nr:hypothetical protein [Rhizobium mesosinicum]